MNVYFIGSKKPVAQQAVQKLIDRYGQADVVDATAICAVGGDGTMLRALHTARTLKATPVYGMRLPDSVGALGNTFQVADLEERLRQARRISIHPLKAEATTWQADTVTCFAINEIVLSRAQLQTAKLHVNVEGFCSGWHLVGDGLLVSTAIGSGGYNLAAGGPLLPWSSGLLALTGLAVRSPSEWCNAAVDEGTVIEVEVMDCRYRPVRIETNFEEISQISRVRISCEDSTPLTLLVDQ